MGNDRQKIPSHLGRRSFGGIGEYGDDFLDFVEGNSAFFPADRQAFYCYQWVRSGYEHY